jgi:hypothetical protein
MKEKKKKEIKPKKPKVPKTRNNGTFTESQFFSWLRSRLRRMSIYWKPIQQVRKNAQVPYVGENKRRKFSYKCENCGGLFSAQETSVHHVTECGQLKSFEDLPGFCERLFIEADQGLILICNNCHDKLHNKNQEINND